MASGHNASAHDTAETTPSIGLVKEAHQRSYADPLAVKAGDSVKLSGKTDQWHDRPEWTFLRCTNPAGKEGWVPQIFIDQQGATGSVRQDYDCGELTVIVGELVALGDGVCGWIWCTNSQGQSGWVPQECVAPLS